ncbi:MAG: hypothetical protein COB02_06395 [Candidatus Cloacimonadota bacterium]|nr:MAG: hypothetical protein COB02_06395 [Candidatus Cloacimonadota bacterium]
MYILNNILLLVLDAAPYLLMGFFIAGLIKTFLSEELIQKTLGKNDVKTVALASLIGAPVPLCSCGVIPVVQGIRKQGASKGATIAFLVSTPETGVDSVAMTYGMMGPGMAIIRPIYAVIVGFFAGLVELLLFKDDELTEQKKACCSSKKKEQTVEEKKDSCCSSKVEKKEVVEEKKSCCSSKKEEKIVEKKTSPCCSSKNKAPKKDSLITQILNGLKYSFVNLLRDISPTLLFGFVVGGVISSILSEDLVKNYFSGTMTGYLGMVLLAAPMYICATSSTPIAAAFMLKGMSPGTALVFLMAGPATNFTSLSILSKIFGVKSIVSYLSVIIVSSICFGLLTDYLILKKVFEVHLSLQHAHEHQHGATWLQIISTIVFMLPVFYYSIEAFVKKFRS